MIGTMDSTRRRPRKPRHRLFTPTCSTRPRVNSTGNSHTHSHTHAHVQTADRSWLDHLPVHARSTTMTPWWPSIAPVRRDGHTSCLVFHAALSIMEQSASGLCFTRWWRCCVGFARIQNHALAGVVMHCDEGDCGDLTVAVRVQKHELHVRVKNE